METVKTIKLREFNDGDWCAYSGCEADKPLVSEDDFSVALADGKEVLGFVVVDNSTIQFDLCYDPNDDLEYEQHCFSAEMLTPAAAKFFVECLPLEGLTAERLESLGFDKII